MKIEYENLEDVVTKITTKVLDHIMDLAQNEKPKLIAICENFEPIDINAQLLSQNEKQIILGDDFQNLTSKEKLIVVKASINTHYQMTEGWVYGYGVIINYELIYNKFLEQKKILFSCKGELIEETMEQYI